MFVPASSCCSDSVNPRTANLLAQYALCPIAPTNPSRLDVFTMCARFSFFSSGRKKCTPWITPQKFTSISQRKSSSESSSKFPSSATPALLNTTDARPCCAATSSANAFTLAASPTSTRCCVTFPCALPSSATVSASPFSFTSDSASDAPMAANCCARQRPIPDPAPVITATLSLKNDISAPASLDSPRIVQRSLSSKERPHNALIPHFTRAQPAPASHVLGRVRLCFLRYPKLLRGEVWIITEMRSGESLSANFCVNRKRHAHLIAPGAFCFVQHLVGFAHQRRKLLHILALKSRHAKTCRHAHALPRQRKRQRRKLFPEAVYHCFYVLRIHVRDHKQKLVAAQPPGNVRSPRVLPQSLCERLQHRVARVVPERVVDAFEAVNVSQHHPQRVAVPRRPAQLFRRPVLDRAPVRQPRQGICARRLFELPALRRQLAVQVHDASSHADPRQHFPGIERLRQVIVRARLQPFHHVALFRVAGHQDQVGVRLRLIRPYALAQFRPGNIGHHPVRNHDAWRVLLEHAQRFLAVARKQQRIRLLVQHLLDEFPVHRRIVNHQHFVF